MVNPKKKSPTANDGGQTKLTKNDLAHPFCVEKFTTGLISTLVGVSAKIIPLGLG